MSILIWTAIVHFVAGILITGSIAFVYEDEPPRANKEQTVALWVFWITMVAVIAWWTWGVPADTPTFLEAM